MIDKSILLRRLILHPWTAACTVALTSVTATIVLSRSATFSHQAAPLAPASSQKETRSLTSHHAAIHTNSMSTIGGALRQAKSDALWGMLIADAVAMPVHWYYDPEDIKRGYKGWLTGYRTPNDKHPSSILSLSAVDGSGRNGWHKNSKTLIGDVILHDKLRYWKAGRSTHYHQGMQAGDNTLNALCALQIYKTMQSVDAAATMPERDLQAAVLENYVKFMTTPGTHNDTYAESWHRAFFRDWCSEENPAKTASEVIKFAEQRSKRLLSASPDSQLAVIGAFVTAIPWIVRSAHQSEEACVKSTVDFVRLTHPVASLEAHVETYTRLLHSVLNGADLREQIDKVLASQGFAARRKRDLILRFSEQAQRLTGHHSDQLEIYQEATSTLGSACYIEGALYTMLFLAREFHNDFEGGVLTNANCGGENCHRGAALGALLGAAAIYNKQPIPQKWKDGLHSAKTTIIDITAKL